MSKHGSSHPRPSGHHGGSHGSHHGPSAAKRQHAVIPNSRHGVGKKTGHSGGIKIAGGIKPATGD